MADGIDELRRAGAERVWLDFKYADTSDAVLKRSQRAASAGVNWITVHAGGGVRMVEAAKKSGLYVIAVTLLSSLSDNEVRDLYNNEPDVVVGKLADWALQGGADAIVCPPARMRTLYEWRQVRSDAEHIKLISPGTRSEGAAWNDQAQVEEPRATISNGADYLVVGRQATEDPDPLSVINLVAHEIRPAIEARIKEGTWRD